jgi:hypothetical protein
MGGQMSIEEQRRGRDENEVVRYRWCWEPDPGTRELPTVGRWCDTVTEARQAGTIWLNEPAARPRRPRRPMVDADTCSMGFSEEPCVHGTRASRYCPQCEGT